MVVRGFTEWELTLISIFFKEDKTITKCNDSVDGSMLRWSFKS